MQNPEQPAPQAGLPTPNPILAAISAFFSYWLVSWILIPVGLVLLLHYYVFSAYHVVGTSMIPTLQDSNYLIVSKVERTTAVVRHKAYIPKREQVIVFRYPKDPTLDFVKRVIGLPGERVVVRNCNVTIYNKAHPDGFNPDTAHRFAGTCTEGAIDTTVPDDNVFVLGDNRTPEGSSDSREWGFLPSDNIIGNVVLRLYPLNSVHIF